MVIVSVQAEKAAQQDLTATVSGDAVLTPQAQAAIVPKIVSPVKKFYVQRGAHVHEGQLLASLENADLSASVLDTKGSLQQAQAAYDTSIQAQIPEDRQHAELDVEQAKANLDVAKTVTDSRKHLLDEGAIPRRDYDTAAASYVQAKATYDLAEHHLASLKSVSQKAAISSAEGGLGSAKGKYAAAAADLGYTEIRSPINGVVTDRPLFSGETPQAGAPLITVMDTSVLIAKVHLAAASLEGVKLGNEATLTIAGADAPVKATVSLISPATDPGSTTIEVWVKVPNKEGELKAGTPVHVEIATATVKDAITVPNEAIVSGKNDKPAVMVIGEDGVAHSMPVKVGISDGKDTEITSGVKAGDLVVTKGAYGMDDGTKVKVVAAAEGDDDDKGAADDSKASDDKPSAGTPADDKAGDKSDTKDDDKK